MLNSNDDDDENDDDAVLLLLTEKMNDVLTLKLNVIDFYTHEVINVSHESEFFDTLMSDIMLHSFSFLRRVDVIDVFKFFNDDDNFHFALIYDNFFSLILSSVFVSNLNSQREKISSIMNIFTLNIKQCHVFDLIMHYILHHLSLSDQLLMNVFKEVNTDKTRVIKAMQV